MGLPRWRERQLAEKASAFEERRLQRLTTMFGLENEDDMSGDVLQFPDPETATDADDEPSIALEDDPEVPLEEPRDPPAAAPTEPPPAALVSTALVEILPADFPLPLLAKFIPNPALRAKAEEATTYALGLAVEGQAGLQRADTALSALRATVKDIDDHFTEPCDIAHKLHKRLTAIRGEWTESAMAAIRTVGSRMYTEQTRLERLAAEERRQAQAEADRLVREAAQREAQAAEAARAPAPVVEEMKRQAETVTAPPVMLPASSPAPMRGSTIVKTWKARLAGTLLLEEPQPDVETIGPTQKRAAFDLFVGAAAQLAKDLQLTLEPDYLTKCRPTPLGAVAINWSYLDRRAKADKSTLAIPGIEAYEEGGVRAKGIRSR